MTEINKDPWSMTLLEFVKFAQLTNAGLLSLSSCVDDKPTVMVTLVRGEKACAEMAAFATGLQEGQA